MTIDVRIGGALRRVGQIRARIGGQLRQIRSIHARIGGALRQLFVSGLSAQTTITLTSGSYSGVVSGNDSRHYGYYPGPGLGGGFGSRSPTTADGYTITDLREVLLFSSNDGSYSGLTGRRIILELSGGPAPLEVGFITSLLASGQTLPSVSVSNFSSAADGGQWIWNVALGSDDGSPDFLPSGTHTLNP